MSTERSWFMYSETRPIYGRHKGNVVFLLQYIAKIEYDADGATNI